MYQRTMFGVVLESLVHLLAKLIFDLAVKPSQNNVYFGPTTGLTGSFRYKFWNTNSGTALPALFAC